MADVQEAKRLLEKATTDCKAAKSVADQQGNYLATKSRAQTACSELKKLPADKQALITKDLESIETQIKQAAAKAEKDRKLDEAMVLLASAQKTLDQARIKTDMHANLFSAAPNADFVKMLLKESGDPKVLDQLVAKMGDKTSRQVLEIAIEARFGVDFQQFLSKDGVEIVKPPKKPKTIHGTSDKTAPDKSMKRMYELLQKVPESHVKKNPLLKEIRRFQEDNTGGEWSKSKGRIELYAGRAGAGTSHNQASELSSFQYFPEGVDKECQPVAGATDKHISYFDWATLHEVGHAVDDKNKFMEKNMGGKEFGAWKDYDVDDVSEPAKAAQKHFKYDLGYIVKRLKWKTPDAAPKPAGVAKDEWEKRKEAVDNWSDLIMNDLWYNGAAVKLAAIGDRVYQLAYGTKDEGYVYYVSYALAARRGGIHPYQFRAPAEWFAELYAAYYMGVLKKEHPAVKDWLPGKLK